MLYVVQRMAELSTLFVLLGMVGYVYGRRRLESAPRQAYALMGAAVVLGTGLAALSKENGALLPLLLLVLEGTLFARRSVRPSPAFLAGFLVAPAVVVVAYLGWHTWTVPDHVWTQRGFTALERL
ncbi:MAG: tetratricopeptide repeat protein, partial [Gammaproteobacteria bacterium]|nr:tetratricopeptide repeat protein [Gammaproteobacteria bacterium]